MKNFTDKLTNAILLVQFLVIISFLLSSFFFVIFYGVKIFSVAKNIIFIPIIEKEQEKTLLEFFQDKSLLSLYWRKIPSITDNFFITQVEVYPPDTIRIYTKKRIALAYFIKNGKNFAIDAQGVVFFIEKKDTKELAKLFFSSEKFTDFFNTTEIKKVLELLEWITEHKHFLEKNISSIFLEDSLNTILIFTPQNLPILLGYNFFEEKMKNLTSIFVKLGSDFSNIKQIDARYQDKIILEYK